MVNGQPLAGAPLAFQAIGEVPAEHRTFTAMTDSTGQYKIDPIYPGTYEVIVVDSGVAGGDDAEAQDVVAANPFQSADGKELVVEIGTEPAVYDVHLNRVR